MTKQECAVFGARPLAKVLTRDRSLMDRYKAAAREELVQAIASGGANYVLVTDSEVIAKIRAAGGDLKEYAYDPESGAVSDSSRSA